MAFLALAGRSASVLLKHKRAVMAAGDMVTSVNHQNHPETLSSALIAAILAAASMPALPVRAQISTSAFAFQLPSSLLSCIDDGQLAVRR